MSPFHKSVNHGVYCKVLPKQQQQCDRVRETSGRSGVSGRWRNRSEHGEERGGGVGWRRARFPCPGGPWGVVVADVTSGARPPSLHLHFPSSLVWSAGCAPLCPGLSAACLLREREREESSDPSLCLPHTINTYTTVTTITLIGREQLLPS